MTAPENPPAPAIAPPPSQRPRPPWALALAGLALLAFVAWGFWRAAQPPTPYFQGQMEARETDVAGKVTARIARVLVQEGQRIQPGALLVELDSPEVRAKMAQAEAARDAARAQADKAESGARPEEVQMARLAWQRAQAAADLAQTSWQRVEGLYAQGLVAAQKRDEAQTNARAAAAQAQAARAQYDMAARGARGEDKAAAEAQTRRAAGAVAEVEAAQAETQLRSPVGGEVAKVLAREGELSPQGVASSMRTSWRDRGEAPSSFHTAMGRRCGWPAEKIQHISAMASSGTQLTMAQSRGRERNRRHSRRRLAAKGLTAGPRRSRSCPGGRLRWARPGGRAPRRCGRRSPGCRAWRAMWRSRAARPKSTPRTRPCARPAPAGGR